MKIENQKVNDCRVKLVISAGPEETSEDYGKVTKFYTQRARIPGFRPGKAPLAVIQRTYGRELAADVKAAFQAIADGKFTFVSRGDGSGTHTKELSLWPEALGITAEAESFKDYTDWYVSANAGMGACLVMAEQMGAYILTDKATFLTFVANDGMM